MNAVRSNLPHGPEALTPEAYRAMYDYSPDGVLFTVPDGRVLAANPAACEILGRTEAEICALGRQGLIDPTDERWGPIVAERERSGSVHGVARMVRGDGSPIEVEVSARSFRDAEGAERSCMNIRDVTARVAMERDLPEMSERLRALTLTDELTGLHNRRGFITLGSHLLQLADRQHSTVVLLFLDVDNMKDLNDRYGHSAGDAALQTVGRAISKALRRADVVARLGGDEFVALALGLDESSRASIERRIEDYLSAASTLAVADHRIEVSVGWATRMPHESTTIESLLAEADRDMYRAKAIKGRRPPHFAS